MSRPKGALSLSHSKLVEEMNKLNYQSSNTRLSISAPVTDLREQDFLALREVPLWKRSLAFFNPNSVFLFLSKGGY